MHASIITCLWGLLDCCVGAGRKDPASAITATLPADNILDGRGRKNGKRMATES